MSEDLVFYVFRYLDNGGAKLLADFDNFDGFGASKAIKFKNECKKMHPDWDLDIRQR